MVFLKAVPEGYRKENRRVLRGALCLNIASQEKSGVEPKLSSSGASFASNYEKSGVHQSSATAGVAYTFNYEKKRGALDCLSLTATTSQRKTYRSSSFYGFLKFSP